MGSSIAGGSEKPFHELVSSRESFSSAFSSRSLDITSGSSHGRSALLLESFPESSSLPITKLALLSLIFYR